MSFTLPPAALLAAACSAAYALRRQRRPRRRRPRPRPVAGEGGAGVSKAAPHVGFAWALPSRWTFQVPPIRRFVERWTADAAVIVDPFCGQSTFHTHGNDLARGGMKAEDFLDHLVAGGVVADVVIFDPPYSPRQIAECYRSAGLVACRADTQNAALYRRVRQRLSALLKPGGVALSFGWQSGGFGKQWPTLEVLIVQHGGAHNDTFCVAQQKPTERPHP